MALSAAGRILLLVLGAMLLSAAPALAQERPAPAAPSAGEPLVVNCYDRGRDVVMRALASDCHGQVVSDTEAQAIRNRRSRAIIKALTAPTTRLAPAGTRLTRLGTAFFVDDHGRLLTNNHVIADCTALVVEPTTGAPLLARLQAVDVRDDLALVAVAAASPGVAPFRARMLTDPGAFVAAIGYPDQGLPPRQPLATAGELQHPPPGTTWGERLMIKADIEPGDSGSPLLERHGLVIGVMNAKANTPLIYQKTGAVISDRGFGIPLPVVLDFLRRNGVVWRSGQARAALTAAQLLSVARRYVARIDCWR